MQKELRPSNTNGTAVAPNRKHRTDVSRKEYEKVLEYAERWGVVVTNDQVFFYSERSDKHVHTSPVRGSALDEGCGLIWVVRDASPYMLLHELGHLLLTQTLGRPGIHDEDEELCAFEYLSVRYLSLPLRKWKYWRTRTGSSANARYGTPSEGQLSLAYALKNISTTAFHRTGLFAGDYPTFKHFVPLPLRVPRRRTTTDVSTE